MSRPADMAFLLRLWITRRVYGFQQLVRRPPYGDPVAGVELVAVDPARVVVAGQAAVLRCPQVQPQVRVRSAAAMRGRWLLAAPLVLVGCSSPGDVEQRYARRMGEAQEDLIRAQQGVDDARRGYESDLASAKEWDVHVLGIPASGWVFLLILAGIAVAILAAWAIYQLRQSSDERRIVRENREKRAHQLLVEKERTRQAELAAQKAEYDSVQRYVPPSLSKVEEG